MAKTPKKFRGTPEKITQARYYITGGVLNGYTIMDRLHDVERDTFENMWDAIKKKNELNG
jgi:hypothetical protein